MSRLNGSVGRFAEALGDLVREAVTEGVEPFQERVGSLDHRVESLESRVNQGFNQINERLDRIEAQSEKR